MTFGSKVNKYVILKKRDQAVKTRILLIPTFVTLGVPFKFSSFGWRKLTETK